MAASQGNVDDLQEWVRRYEANLDRLAKIHDKLQGMSGHLIAIGESLAGRRQASEVGRHLAAITDFEPTLAEYRAMRELCITQRDMLHFQGAETPIIEYLKY